MALAVAVLHQRYIVPITSIVAVTSMPITCTLVGIDCCWDIDTLWKIGTLYQNESDTAWVRRYVLDRYFPVILNLWH